MNILVSACLIGTPCRYDGRDVPCEKMNLLKKKYNLIPVCPELLGGLKAPRHPAECIGNKVFSKDGSEVTKEFNKGAEETLKLADKYKCNYAVLKEKSPSCGSGIIYDGSFTGKLIEGYGVTARLLKDHGIKVFGESEIDLLLSEMAEL